MHGNWFMNGNKKLFNQLVIPNLLKSFENMPSFFYLNLNRSTSPFEFFINNITVS